MSGSSTLITCSIICYNYGRFLGGAIESCLFQTLDPSLFEILVIDDGSTDDTPEVCANYAGRIRVSRSENLGFAASLSRALREANGTYVALLDADDWWSPDKLSTLLPLLESGKLVVMHPMYQVDEEGNLLGKEVGSCGNTSSICVHREAATTLLPGTSELFCHPLVDHGLGEKITTPLGFYRIHAKAMTDRSPANSYTEFFARTSHVTADRLAELSMDPPFWANSAEELVKLSWIYRAEGYFKDFWRATELRNIRRYPSAFFNLACAMFRGRKNPGRREARLVARALRSIFSFRASR